MKIAKQFFPKENLIRPNYIFPYYILNLFIYCMLLSKEILLSKEKCKKCLAILKNNFTCGGVKAWLRLAYLLWSEFQTIIPTLLLAGIINNHKFLKPSKVSNKKKTKLWNLFFVFIWNILVFAINPLKAGNACEIKEKITARFTSFSRHNRVLTEVTIVSKKLKTKEPFWSVKKLIILPCHLFNSDVHLCHFPYFYHSYSTPLNHMGESFSCFGEKWPQLHLIIMEFWESNPIHIKKFWRHTNADNKIYQYLLHIKTICSWYEEGSESPLLLFPSRSLRPI